MSDDPLAQLPPIRTYADHVRDGNIDTKSAVRRAEAAEAVARFYRLELTLVVPSPEAFFEIEAKAARIARGMLEGPLNRPGAGLDG